ncbi:MAG: imidazole glycerol phosphate synthase subunit HisH [Planctomycetaceae bacterium]|nr:MAG: imidazole glycerol phosphate synthase subunit HisH [Planctomycetaceae bacterium]
MITIIDYQMGNLRSVQKAFEAVGGQAVVTSDKRAIANAESLVLPGVGGFGDAIAELRKRDLEAPILDFVRSGRPMLGICLGMQLLFETGFEGGTHRGLGILEGEVVRFEGLAFGGVDGLKVPHMGWNQVVKRTESPILQDIADGTHFYFVHSYYVRPADPAVIALTCDYGGPFSAMIWRDNLYATQFHPEKSQADGLKLLKRFAKLTGDDRSE